MSEIYWLQLFAEGGEGGERAATGETPADAGQARLLELGVPASRIRNRAKKTAPATVQTAEPAAGTAEQAAAAKEETPKETRPEAALSKPSFEELMKDPDYNRQMQAIIQSRLKTSRDAEDKLKALEPAIKAMARQQKMDVNNIDYDKLAKGVLDADTYYADKAVQTGIPEETLRELDEYKEREAQRKAQEAISLEEQQSRAHVLSLVQQGEKLKGVFPDFDLFREMENPVFKAMVRPGSPISVEDAYYAVHRKEIDAARSQIIAQKTAEQMSRTIQAGQQRPREAGTSAQAPTQTHFNYAALSRAEREAFKKQIEAAAANGRKIRPGEERFSR